MSTPEGKAAFSTGAAKTNVDEIKKLANEKSDNLKVVTFNVDKNKEDWLKTNKANKINWPSLWDKDGRFSETFTKYRVLGTPTYYLFDSKGKVVTKWTGFEKNTTVANIEKRIK
jgi:thioredoxin-related protein